jgi:hydroxymethylbilane synthase
MTESICIGTRGSQLALWQANWVKSTLTRIHPDLSVEIIIIKTKGDKILDVPLAKVGGKGLFVKEIEEALIEKRIDLAVHSMKDMPAEIPTGLGISAVPKREMPFDVLVSKNYGSLMDLPQGARIGTSSLRRSAQIMHKRPDIKIVPLRGNLDTRLKKLVTDNLDAVILAAAGMRRLGFEDQITQIFDETTMLPAVGQGALAIEARVDDELIQSILHPLEHIATRIAITAERAFLKRLEGGCQVPIAGYAQIEIENNNDNVRLTGLVASLDGNTIIKETLQKPVAEAKAMGIQLAENLLSRGARSILDELQL